MSNTRPSTAERPLPQYIDAEKAVLGAILVNNDAFTQAATLSADRFYLQAHRMIFDSIARLIRERKPADLISVQYDLEAAKQLEAVGGSIYLASLMDGVSHLAKIDHYAEMIQEAAMKRDMIRTFDRVINDCFDSVPSAEIIGPLQQKLAGLSQPAASIPAHWRWLDVAKRRDWNCVPLRWNIENLIAQGTFVIMAADTQTGKTLLGLFLAFSMLHRGQLFGKFAITPVDKILYLGLEDPDRRFDERIADIESAFPAIADERFIVHTAPGFALIDEEWFTYLENLIRKHGFKLVFIDTYQKATPGLSSFDDEKQSVILQRLSNLTRKLGVTIIVLDHFRKQAQGKRNHSDADISDIKGTGAKPQNADCIILLERTGDRKQMKLQSFSKDTDVNVRILLNISPKGSPDTKFTYAADLEKLGATASEQGQENRKKVLDALKPKPGEKVERMKASTVAERTGLADATVRRHLKALIQAKQVDACGKGNGRYYWFSAEDIAQDIAQQKSAG